MNTPVSTNSVSQLPAHLQHFAQANSIAAAAKGGIVVGANFHQISIKGGKWRLQDPQGGETVIPTHHLDVVVVNANSHESKIFYLKKYNPNDEGSAPDCYSDNGIAPSSRAQHKQCATCAVCPHNVWGSRITENGNEAKACSDNKKLAVILADNPTGPVYLLRVPPASLKNLYAYAELLETRGYDMPMFVTRLEFDAATDYPKVVFTPTGWATVEQAEATLKIQSTNDVKKMIGADDTPATGAVAALPAASSPVAALPGQADPLAGSVTAAPAVTPTAPSAVEEPAPKKRTKKVNTDVPPLPVTAPAPAPASEPTGFFAKMHGAALTVLASPSPAAQVNPAPSTTSAALDDLIKTAMNL